MLPMACFRMAVRFSLLILICSLSKSLLAADTTRIRTYPQYLHLYTTIGPTYSELEIHTPNLDDALSFQPSSDAVIGLGFSYSWLTLQVSFTPPASEESLRRYGRTQKFDFEGHYNLQKYMGNLTLKSYKGFYLDNMESFIENWDDENNVLPQLPTLETFSLSGSLAYVIRPDRFSSNAAYTYTQAMRRSGGSWLVGSFASINAIDSDSIIVPYAIAEQIDYNLDLKSILFYNAGVSFGYAHLFTTRRNYFFSFTILPGLSLQRVIEQSSTERVITSRYEISARSINRLSLGKNTDTFYWGVSTYIESAITRVIDSEINLSSGHVKFFFGYRFNTKGWRFMKPVDRVLHPKILKPIIGEPEPRE